MKNLIPLFFFLFLFALALTACSPAKTLFSENLHSELGEGGFQFSNTMAGEAPDSPQKAPAAQGARLLANAATELRVGETATIVAIDKPSTGYMWNCEISAGSGIVEIVSADKKTVGGDMPGSDERTWHITLKALRPGRAVIDMAEKRGEDTAQKTRYIVIVTENPEAPDPAVFAAYSEILLRERAAMALPDDLSTLEYPDLAEALDIGTGKAEVRDVTSDGMPELIYLTHSKGYEEWLNVWAWAGGKAVKVFGQRVRSLAGGGGNYSVFVAKNGELCVYSSENGSDFAYGFWNVSQHIMANGANGEAGAQDFIMNREKAAMFCRIAEGDIGSAKYLLNGKDATEAGAAAWVRDWAESIGAVLMDSSSARFTLYEGDTVDIGLYSEEFGPWARFAACPYAESCMTWDFALASLRGEGE